MVKFRTFIRPYFRGRGIREGRLVDLAIKIVVRLRHRGVHGSHKVFVGLGGVIKNLRENTETQGIRLRTRLMIYCSSRKSCTS